MPADPEAPTQEAFASPEDLGAFNVSNTAAKRGVTGMLWGHEYDGIMTFARRSARMRMKGCTIQLRRESGGPMVRHRGT
jgi:hypothetical protein